MSNALHIREKRLTSGLGPLTVVLRAFGRVVEGVCSRLERGPTQALAFAVSEEGSERAAVGQAAGTDVRFTVTRDSCDQPLLGSARRGRVHAS